MHIVVPAKGIGPRSWGQDFLAVASELGCDLTKIRSGEPLLYLPDAHGNFSNVPAGTDRFASWVQDLLPTLPGYSGEKISGHSAKCLGGTQQRSDLCSGHTGCSCEKVRGSPR